MNVIYICGVILPTSKHYTGFLERYSKIQGCSTILLIQFHVCYADCEWALKHTQDCAKFVLKIMSEPFPIQEQMSYAPYDEKCDIWSLGCTVHEMCVRKPTFFGLTDVDVAAKIRNANYPTLPDKYSIDLRRAISSMLQLLVSINLVRY